MTHISVFERDIDILESISDIYLDGKWFDLDPTFSKGVMYKGKEPKYKYDIEPVRDDVKQGDSTSLRFMSNTLESIVFDPPFMFRNRAAENKDKMSARFSFFQTFEDLIDMYDKSLYEFHRVLKDRKFLIFKCQDFTDGSGSRPFYDTHCQVIKLARKHMFSVQDIGILVKKNKIIQKGKQGCFRKVHCYYLVFRKEPKMLKYMEKLL